MNKLCKFLGHRFRPRFHVEEKLSSLRDITGEGRVSIQAFPIDWERLAAKLKTTKQTYVCDVCTRCGETNEKDKM